MRNLFTRFLLIVFLSGIVYQTYAGGSAAPVPPLSSDIASLWPEAQSVTQAQPGTGNVFVLEFAKDLHPTAPFGNQSEGVIGLMWESEGFGYQQVETINPVGGDERITVVYPRTIEIRFDYDFEEGETYHITVDANIIRFAEQEWFGGIHYDTDAVPPNPATDPQWQFTIDDVTPPQMVSCSDANNVNGEYNVSVDQDPIVICFSEPVQWAEGADPFKIGNIAFYLAAKDGLDPNDEFGGDVIYARPNAVVLYDEYGDVVLPEGQHTASAESFSKIEIYLKGEPEIENGSAKAPAIGEDHVWPENRDMYMRFSADLLVDEAGNSFAGIHNSPFDPYAIGGQEYWFSTRENGALGASARAVANTSALPGTDRVGNLWATDDIVVTINSGDLEFITDAAITTSNVKNFIKLSVDGSNVTFTVKKINETANATDYLLEPGNLPENKTLKVEVLADQIRDNGTTQEVEYFSAEFETGDFSAPVLTPYLGKYVHNELCTNFDFRVKGDEEGVVYYAIVKEPVAKYWDNELVSADEIYSGVKTSKVGSTTYTYYFNHVQDGAYGQNVTTFIPNSFGINETMFSFEHIDDFTEKNHGDKYRIYYFTFDPTAEGPYSSFEQTLGGGRVSAVAQYQPVQLTDCLEPEVAWWYQDVDPETVWTSCEEFFAETRIKKDSPWKLDFLANKEPIKLVDENLAWEDVVTLQVREYPFGTENTWMPAEIASITPIMEGSDIVGIEVVPLNSYPSGGRVRIVLASGAIEDYAFNTINEIIECRQNVEFYEDPWIDEFIVESKDLLENHEDYDALNGVVAKRDGKITIEFNNPVYTPKRDEDPDGMLDPISLDPEAENYVGKYIKLHEGDETTATINSNLKNDFFSFELFDADGDAIPYPGTAGVKKIVATPKADYASETWYYVEIESLLQDENRRELKFINNNGTWIWDNNLFVDLHELYAPYPTAPFTGDPDTWTAMGNSDKYSMIFRSEDTVAPELRFVFEKFEPAEYPDGGSVWPFIVEEDSAMVNCVNALGFDPDENGIYAPVGAIITEWSKMGFDNKDYYIDTDPNGLRPYFTMYEVGTNGQKSEIAFDVVVLKVYEPNATGPAPYRVDAVWFGFVPFVELSEGKTYAMEFRPEYKAEGSSLDLGPVFEDDNGNALVNNTYVEFTTCEEGVTCFDAALSMSTTTKCSKAVATEGFTPSFTVTFEEDFKINVEATTLFTLWQGTTGIATITTDAGFDYSVANAITVPFTSWGEIELLSDTQYKIELHDEAFLSKVSSLPLCSDETKSFYTPDTTAPVADQLSPDIDHFVLGTDYPSTATATALDVRNPGKLSIRWNEKVSLQPGKVIHLWENGNTKRFTFVAGTHGSLSSSNVWSVTLEEDALVPNTHYHVEVEAGFVIDCQGNPSAHLTGRGDRIEEFEGDADGSDTWTFATGELTAPFVESWTPNCLIEPGNQNSQPIFGTDDVQLNKITLTLDQEVNFVAGKKLILRQVGETTDLLVIDVADMVSSNGTVWTYNATNLLVKRDIAYRLRMEPGAFVASYPANSELVTPSYLGADFFQCDENFSHTFMFSDITAPTVTIWPSNGNTKVPFNAHGYVKFSESVIAKSGNSSLVLTQNNIKNWIKVFKADDLAGSAYSEMDAADYVCEFVNAERTHIRVTFLDEEAPAINGVTANMKDEWKYRIVVNTTGTNGYTLQDNAGNFVGNNETGSATSTFTTEDITPPMFYVTACASGPESVSIEFTPYENTDPYGNGRNYPAEAGKIYYVVRPMGTTVTAEQLFTNALGDVKNVVMTTASKTVTWNLASEADLSTGYNYTVYAVMVDDETNVFEGPSFGNAWPTKDPVFILSGDADPAAGAVGLADIRPAPNKNNLVQTWSFCLCDDDEPQVVSKEHNTELDVEVDATFEIEFDEFIQRGTNVVLGGEGTGGTILTPKYGYEVRLREWNNNVAVPITLMGNGGGTFGLQDATGMIITPVEPLDEETKYYIEIDRWVIWDVPGSNCEEFSNMELPQDVTAIECDGCGEEGNNFPGWIDNKDWWFQTKDNTAPQLAEVSPLGICVPVDADEIVFTFEEKNGMMIHQLSGQASNLYIYKDGLTVPYEIISAPGVVDGPFNGDEWTITYPINKTFGSEENYYVLWHKDKFTDLAGHPYIVTTSDVVDYPLDNEWNQFGFTSADSKMPVVNWAVVNYFFNEGGVKLIEGEFDNNDELAATTDLCELGKIPQEIGFVVWFDEDVNLASVSSTPSNTFKNRWMQANFFLDEGKSVKWVADGTAGTGGEVIHGVEVPEGMRYFVLQPLTTLPSNGEFQFGIIANKISDDNPTKCRENMLPETTLVNFCIWDADQAVANLFDGDELDVEEDRDFECVAEAPTFRLKFDKRMAKTSQVVHYYNMFGTSSGENFNNIWLGAQASDFENSDNSQIIKFYDSEGAYVEFSSVEVVTIGEEFLFTLKEPLESEGTYTFEILDGALKDIVRIPDGNAYEGYSWTFTVTDWIAPQIVENGLTPADGAVNVSPMTNLVIKFDEEVVRGGADSYIVIRSKDKVYYKYAANDAAHVTLASSGTPKKTTVTINHGGLDPDTEYFVEIEPGFVVDKYCGFLPFGGSAEQSYVDPEWNFTTGDEDGPVANLWPVPGTECVAIDANLVIRFDENIELTDNGVVHIYKVRENETWHGTNFGDIVEVIEFTSENYPQVKISGSDVANGRTHDVVTITPSEGLWESDATYYVRIIGNGVTEPTEADVLVDANNNSWMYPVPVGHGFTLLPGIHHNQWYFTIGNNDEPVLAGVTPEWGEVVEAGVAGAVADLSMTFEDEVAFGTGSIKVYEFIEVPEGGTAAQEANLWATFNVPEHVNDGTITLSDDLKTVTINGVELLDGINWYYVTVDPGTITNNVECTLRGWSGISNPDQWLFSTAPDVTAPVLDDSDITSDACSEQYLKPATIEFELEFSEGVSVANGTGLVEIREVGGDVVAYARIVPNMIEDNVLKMVIADFTGAIADQTQYELVIGGDAIHDNATASLAGKQDPVGLVPFGNENWFAGVVLPFETGDFTAPTATQFVALDGVQDDMNALENAITMVVTFDEAVQDGAGLLHLMNADTDAVVATFDAANDEDSDPLTVTFSTNLPDETSYYVLVDEGFVTDMLYNDACDAVRNNVAMDEDAWSFTIDDNTIPAITADLTEDTDNLMMSFDIVLQYNDIISAVDANKATLTLDGNAVPSGVTGAVVGADPTQVIVSVTVAMDQTDYMLSLADGFALDDATYANASEAVVTGPYHVGDRTIPVLEANMPVGILTSYIDVEVAVDFFDDSELSVVAPFLVLDADDNEVAQWTPDLKNEEQTASFYPTLWFGSYKVVIPAGSVVDANGNAFGGHTWNFSIIDNIFDTDCLTKANFKPADGDACVTATPDLVIEFCERIDDLATDKYVKVYELNSTGDNEAVAEILVTQAMINLNVLTIPLDATTIMTAYNDGKGMLKDNQDYIVMIEDGAIYDEAGNSWEGISDPTFWNFTTGDNTAPTAVLVPAEGTNTKNAIAVNVEFSEPVLGAVDKVTVAGATSYTVVATADPLVYTVNIDAVDLATITVTVPTTITDVNCNFNALAEEVTGTYVVGDNTPPTVTVTAAPANPMNTERTFTVELTFSEVVAGVTKEAALANSVGLVDVATTDNIVYTLTFEGADETEGVLNLNKDLVTDVSANANKLVEGINWVFKVGDWVAPTAVVEPASGSDLRDAVLNVNVTFSEEVVGATLGQGIVVTGGTATISNDGLVYTVAITANDGATVTLTLNNKIKDDSFNANALANTGSYSYTFGDRTPPTVSVDPATAVSTPTSFDVLIVFNEDVTGAGTGSILLTGEGAQISLTPVVAGRVYKATLTGAEKAELTLSFTTAIKDLAGNPLVPASFTYTVGDYTAPTMTADPASGNFITNEIVVTLTFDEDVTGVAAATTVSAGSVVVTGEGSVYTAVITAPSLSTVTLTVGSAVEDLAGNNFAGANFSYTVTGLVPIATIQGEVSTSPLVGKVLQVEGTITGISPFEGFFVQDASAAWSGIWVAYNNTEGLAIGDGVHITGQVAEVSSVTTINASAVTEIDAPLTVAPVVVASPNDAKKEMYESVLVQVLGAEASEANDIGDWVVAYAPLNRVTVANWFYLYTPVAGYSYHVTGIVNARLGNFKLEPRMRADIEAGNIETVQSKVSQSAWIGETVNLTATVTGVVPAEGFFMQDANAAWSGVWVAFGNNANLSVGDGVHVSGVVAEVSNVTTINAVTVTKVTAPIAIEPVVVANSEAGSPAAAKQEQYESVLVKVEGARANAANDIGQWTIYYQPIQNVVVNNWMYAYTPEADHYYDVTGVVNARLDNFRLEPRMSSDIVDLTLTSVDPVKTVEFSVYPNPFNTHINIDNHDKLSRVVITNIAGQRVMDVTYPEHQIRTDNLVSGVYVVSMFTEEGLAKTERIVKR